MRPVPILAGLLAERLEVLAAVAVEVFRVGRGAEVGEGAHEGIALVATVETDPFAEQARGNAVRITGATNCDCRTPNARPPAFAAGGLQRRKPHRYSGSTSTSTGRRGELALLVVARRGALAERLLAETGLADALFVLRHGRVKVVRVGEDGREVILGVLGPGQYFGELSLIDDGPRSAHVIAMEDASLIVLRREA